MLKHLVIQLLTIILSISLATPANAQLFGKKSSKKNLIKEREQLLITIDSLKSIIDGGARHHNRIGDGNNLVLGRANTYHQRRFLNHIACGVIEFDTIAHFERAHVGDHHAGNDIANHRTGTQRDNQTEEYRYALKCTRTGSGKIGIDHGQHKGIKQESDHVIGRQCPIGREATQLQSFSFYLGGTIA